MSRVGRKPIPIPSGVNVDVQGVSVTVTGPRGALKRDIHPAMQLQQDDGSLVVSRSTDTREHRALHGLTRSLLSNMVVGVTDGFRKEMELIGVGYRAQMAGEKLVMQLGFSHPVEIVPVPGITYQVIGNNRVVVAGIDKEQVGQQAANVRKWRPPEPYKGKGLRYVGEYVVRKAGKGGRVGGKKGR